jgi:WhiB family transcriptional regulator, redox-sensing transcriptional regulator
LDPRAGPPGRLPARGCSEPATDERSGLCKGHARLQPVGGDQRPAKFPNPPRPLRPPPWAQFAACQDTSAAFFIEGKSKTVRQEVERCKAICAACPVRARCLDFGFQEPYGVWGATTSVERRRLRKSRQQQAA